MRCIFQNSYAPFLKYGNPDPSFLRKFKFFLYISNNWLKLWSKMIFLLFQHSLFWNNQEITLKVGGNPEKISKNSKCRKSWQKPYLIVEMYLEGDWITLNAYFLHFSKYIKMWDFGSKLRPLNGIFAP